MKLLRVVALLIAAIAGLSEASAQTPKVNISMNVFPTNLANPNGGGTWTLVAKTDSTHGIAAISFWVLRVSVVGITSETDIGNIANGGNPYFGTFGGITNLVYGQDTATPAAVVVGVGTPLKSDGPDPLHNPLWDGATRLISGSYPSLVPAFSTTAGSITGANTLSTSTPPFNTSVVAMVTTVVRVIPEPSTVVLALGIPLALVGVKRRR